ncbi:MAG: hypothetical protein HOL85_16345 [Rhodospirillaceae bacterium]|nr:hypothetical protein [Rhodospirillaceae bacterium]
MTIAAGTTAAYSLTVQTKIEALTMLRTILILTATAFALSGCAAAAAPCRATSAVIQVIPLIGDPIATVFEACGDAID